MLCGCADFDKEYLRSPKEDGTRYLMNRHAVMGLLGATGSPDRSEWKIYCGDVVEQRINIGKYGVPELRIATVADERLWI